MKWRWDQGRLDYFQLDEIARLSAALVELDGQPLPRREEEDTLRIVLREHSERPFLPNNPQYKIWRNYKRVFGCQMIATEISGRLVCTDLCRKLASQEIDGDQYLLHFINNFYYPSPVFEDYSVHGRQLYPLVSVVKFLLSEYIYKNKPFVTIEEIVGTLRNSEFTGNERIEEFSKLEVVSHDLNNLGDELRQIREMISFTSQISFLKWKNPKLLLDISTKEEALEIEKMLSPSNKPRNANPSLELIELGANIVEKDFDFSKVQDFVFDEEFTEGSRIRVTHVRRERSTRLKEFYFALPNINPHICDMCSMDTISKYSWVSRLIELHHLLPLSSSIRVEKDTTSLKDIVGLCPSCHRATHKYYSKWFKSNGQKDFKTRDEAHFVYDQAKNEVGLSK